MNRFGWICCVLCFGFRRCLPKEMPELFGFREFYLFLCLVLRRSTQHKFGPLGLRVLCERITGTWLAFARLWHGRSLALKMFRQSWSIRGRPLKARGVTIDEEDPGGFDFP
jgi:hypothetical protein